VDEFHPGDMIANGTRPNPELFRKYLKMFMDESICDVNCGVCGWGHFFDTHLNDDRTNVMQSRFMTYHTVLKTQSDFIGALKSARDIAS
jgi:hypothetical protein